MPVVIAGGPKTEFQLEVLAFVYDGLQRGAAGVNLGRNIWQDAAPEEAFELYQSMRKAVDS